MEPIAWDRSFGEGPSVRGSLHAAEGAKDAVVLAHGAGGDRRGKLLVTIADALAEEGFAALRIDLPYRQKRPGGPPHPSGAAADREGIKRAAESLRESYTGRIFLAGSSYGGRQASMLAAEQPDTAAGLLLLSYPLHPPGKPERLRTEHWPRIAVPVLFVHGSKDAFGSAHEMGSARPLLAVRSELLLIDGASHGLVGAKTADSKARALAADIARAFSRFVGPS